MATGIGRAARRRIFLTLVGGCAGLCLYLLIEVLDRGTIAPHLHLFLTTLAVVFFGGLLALAGPLGARRATAAALAVALPTAALADWASLRFTDPTRILDAPESMLALLLVATLPLPYLIAAILPRTGWRDYPTLFTQSWGLVVRYASAWLFAGAIWAVLFLSDALLQLAGISALHDLIEIDAVPYVLTGLALGLGLAVVNELSDYVSPFLVLRLLRLLAPPMALVVAIFLVSLRVRGLGVLFGQVSGAATLLAIAVAAATLVSIALDQSDTEAVENRLMVASVKALALMLPLLALLAGWAMWLRIAQYGLTPARIAGALGAAVVLGYGLLYAVSVLMGGAWMARIRAGNSFMALAVIALAVLWLTPLLNAEAISARDLVQRYRDGRTPADTLDIGASEHRLGRAGTAALAQLRAMAARPGQEHLRARLDAYEHGRPTPSGQDTATDAAALRAQVLRVMPLRPEGQPGADALRDAALARLDRLDLRSLLAGCTQPLSGGQPGCVMVAADFWPDRPGDEALILWHDSAGYLHGKAFAQDTPSTLRPLRWHDMAASAQTADQGESVLEGVLSGDFTMAPPTARALKAGPAEIMLQP